MTGPRPRWPLPGTFDPTPPGDAAEVPMSRVTRMRRLARRMVRPPQTGWGSVLALFVMLLVTGLAMDAPRLANVGPSGASRTAFLPAVIVVSGLVGLIIARSPLPMVLGHLAGTIVGVSVLLVSWANSISIAPTLVARLADVNRAAATLFEDVVVEHGRTEETIGFLIVVGAIAWTTGQFAMVNLVRRGIVAPAIVAIGTLVLVVALAPTVGEGAIYPHLVLLTGLALLLVLRSNLAQQQAGWRRRRIAGGRGVEQLFLRGGAMVCVIALGGASLLAANVVAAPFKDTLTSFDQRLLDLADAIDTLFGGIATGNAAPTGSYGDSTPISDSWNTSDEVVFTARSDDERGHYWRGAAFTRFDGRAWSRDRRLATSDEVSGFSELLAGSGDAVSQDTTGTRDISVTITNRSLDGRTLLSPAVPLSVDRDTRVILDGAGGPFGEIEFRDELAAGDAYTVGARVPSRGERGPTQGRLAAAGIVYPEWTRRYVEVVPGTLSDEASLAAERVAHGPEGSPQDPLHVAQRVEAWLAGSGPSADDPFAFQYATDIRGICRPTEGVVDCLLREQVGFCQQYATAMTLMLRDRGIPARYVQGFLPGQRLAEGTFEVPMSAAHAWVEVYFPGNGWVRFDPTPGGNRENGQSTSDLPLGDPVPTPTPPDAGAPDPTPVFSDPPTPSPEPPLVTPPPDPPDAGMLGLDLPWPWLLLVVVGIVGLIGAIVRLRRLPGRTPDLLYRAMAATAARSGHGPRPEQTAYEFTATLAETLPGATRDLHAVAQAKVESTYGRRVAGGASLDALVESYRRARRALLVLVVWRRGRR